MIEVTFFDWPHLRIAPNHAGTGEISTTELRVSGRNAHDWWAGRFAEHGVRHGGDEKRDGRSFIAFLDPEGQRLQLADEGEDPAVAGGVPWEESSVPGEFGIRGLGAVDLTVRDLRPTVWVLAEVLGFRLAGEYEENGEQVTLFEVGPGGPGARVRVIESPDAPQAHLGERLSLPPFLEERREEIEDRLEPIPVTGDASRG